MVEEYKKFLGQWVYRSLRNDTDLAKEFNQLEFGRGIITIDSIGEDFIAEAALRIPGNGVPDYYVLNLTGELVRRENQIAEIKMRGEGIDNSSTEGWVYDYSGFLIPAWSNGIDQAFVITGSVFRVSDHGTAKAGYVGTFYMVHK